MISIILNYLGILVMFSSIFYLFPIIVALTYREPIIPFVFAMLCSLLFGFLIKTMSNIKIFLSNYEKRNLNCSEAMILSAWTLVSLSVFSSLVYLFYLNSSSIGTLIINSFFESVSGFTTTGLTIIPKVSVMPHSLLFWRSLTQWIGGIGIVIMFVYLVTNFGSGKKRPTQASQLVESNMRLYTSQGFTEKIEPSLKKTTFDILKIYSVYTIIGIVALFIAGLGVFEAITICFTAIATGGFVVVDKFYSSIPQLIIIIILMILGASSFLVHDKLFKRKIKEFLFDYRYKVFFAILFIGIIILLFSGLNITQAVFQLTSALTGTGFSIVDNKMLVPLFHMILILFMIVGGMLGSTCGGIKISRFFIALKSIPWILKKLSNPKTAIIPFKLKKDTPLEDSQIVITYVYIASYVFLLLIGIIAFLIMKYSFLDSVFQITSALGTVGLTTMSLVTVPIIGKVILVFLMLFGRLEIFPLFLLIRKLFKNN